MNEIKKTNSDFLVTRPTLAIRLINSGIDCRMITNPYKQELKAWIVKLDKPTAGIIKAFYDSIGKPIPPAVAELLQEEGERNA